MTTIAIDAMGGDHGPSVTVPAALSVLEECPTLGLILVGDRRAIQLALKDAHFDPERLVVYHASQQVAMDELPSVALRTKKGSSMRLAIDLVKEAKAKACVSAGNTGALMATARFVLKTLPGIDRPAIISAFPTMKGQKKMRMLDLGANVDSSAEGLVQFAVMGSVLASAMDNLPSPKVYLLNIGEEEIKGNEQVKQTIRLLSNYPNINFAGSIEGDAIYKGDADIVVCDGFVGNVALKTTEGVAHFITELIKSAFMRNLLTRCVGLLAKPVLKSFIKHIDPDQYNGATLIGLNGIVIKSHGSAKIKAFAHAIHEAVIEVEKNVPDRIRNEVANLLAPPSLPGKQ